jgi:hypothetical protein
MRALFVAATLLAVPFAARAAVCGAPEQMLAWKARQPELAEEAKAFQGDARMKRLFEVDLRRASRDVEALDHPARLLAGDA